MSVREESWTANYASLGLEGKGEKLTRKFPREDAQKLLSLDHRMPMFAS